MLLCWLLTSCPWQVLLLPQMRLCDSKPLSQLWAEFWDKELIITFGNVSDPGGTLTPWYWRMTTKSFDYKATYIPGSRNFLKDTLSLLGCALSGFSHTLLLSCSIGMWYNMFQQRQNLLRSSFFNFYNIGQSSSYDRWCLLYWSNLLCLFPLSQFSALYVLIDPFSFKAFFEMLNDQYKVNTSQYQYKGNCLSRNFELN